MNSYLSEKTEKKYDKQKVYVTCFIYLENRESIKTVNR